MAAIPDGKAAWINKPQQLQSLPPSADNGWMYFFYYYYTKQSKPFLLDWMAF